MFERFTDRARRVLVLAQEEARLLSHSFIGTEHILLGLIHEDDGVAATAIKSLDITLEAVREKVEQTIGPAGSAPKGSPPFTPRAKKVLELSLREALQLGHNYIGTEHILLGLVREGEGVAAQVLVSLGADLPRVRQAVMGLIGQPGPSITTSVTGPAVIPPWSEAAGRDPPMHPVGKVRIFQVVRAGRRPDDFANAFAELAALAGLEGFDVGDLDASDITMTSVETTEGPGIMVFVKYKIEDHGPSSP